METQQIEVDQKVNVFGIAIPIEVYDFFKTAGIVLILCGFVYIFIATPNQVEGDSMLPTLASHELIITDKIDQIINTFNQSLGIKYTRGDIIVFQKPGYRDFVKRIIGLPGEKVSIKSGHIFINQKELEEDYLMDVYTVGGDFINSNEIEILIPENRFFVLGDNRMDSLDSRYTDIGLINKDWIKGKVIARYWPLTRFSLFNKPNYNI